jgi:hypothetical protein
MCVRFGLSMLTPADTTKWQKQIEATSKQIDDLTHLAHEGFVDHIDFDLYLRDLHAAGFFPENGLVSAVAQALM